MFNKIYRQVQIKTLVDSVSKVLTFMAIKYQPINVTVLVAPHH